MKILESKFVQGFIKMANDGYLQGWHERNLSQNHTSIPKYLCQFCPAIHPVQKIFTVIFAEIL